MSITTAGPQRPSAGTENSGHGRTLSETSSQKSYEERCVDPVEGWPQNRDTQNAKKADLKDTNGRESEIIGFIPGSADTTSGAQSCGLCASPGSCRSFVCTVLTCGLYRVCQRTVFASCFKPVESPPVEPEKVSLRAMSMSDKEEQDGADWPEDIYIGGVRVQSQREDLNMVSRTPSYVTVKRVSPPSFYESMNDDDWVEGSGDVDSLITKKLMELYSEYQIEELCRCTTDSVFLKKTNEINQLINDLAEEHKLDEREAETRIVRGIIRISTRKSKKKRPQYNTKTSRAHSDSGNETLRESDSFLLSNNNDYNVQISEETHSDIYARNLRKHSGGSPTTDSSGVSSFHTSVRT